MGKALFSWAGTVPGPQAEPGVITAGAHARARASLFNNCQLRFQAQRAAAPFIYLFIYSVIHMYIRHTLA